MSLLSRLLGRKRPFSSSGAYWKDRYARGRTSGPGSYGRLAAYKAEVINGLVAEKGIKSVIEFGSGDGNQAAMFDVPGYTGVDVVPQVVEAARKRFVDRPGWSFRTTTEDAAIADAHDLSMSLDVIYHLVEDEVYEPYMRRLCDAGRRFVLIYATDRDRPRPEAHVRDRRYSDWIAAQAPELVEEKVWEHPYKADDAVLNARDRTTAFFRLYRREVAA